jgi:hypothetical protein
MSKGKKGADDSVEGLSARLDAEIARRKELTMKVGEKEAQADKMALQAEAEDVALGDETAAKKAELERLREAIAKATAAVEQRRRDAVRIASMASGVDMAMASLKAQMALRFVSGVVAGPRLTDEEIDEIADSATAASRGRGRPQLLQRCNTDDPSGTAAKQAAAHAIVRQWSLEREAEGLDLSVPALVADRLLMAFAAQVERTPPVALADAQPPAASPPSSSPQSPPSPSRGGAAGRGVTVLPAAPPTPRAPMVPCQALGCSVAEAERMVEGMLRVHLRRTTALVVQAHNTGRTTARRATFDDLAGGDQLLPSYVS